MYHGNPQCLGWISHQPPTNPLPKIHPNQPNQKKGVRGVNLGNQGNGVVTPTPTLNQTKWSNPSFGENDSPKLLGKTKKTDLLPKKLVLRSHKSQDHRKGVKPAWSARIFRRRDFWINNYFWKDPKCSMYGIFTYIYHKFVVNVGKYSIHGAYGDGTLNQPEMRKHCSSQNGFEHLLP